MSTPHHMSFPTIPPRRRRSPWLWVVLVIVVTMFVSCAALVVRESAPDLPGSTVTGPVPAPAAAGGATLTDDARPDRRVTYRVEGSGRATVTWVTGSGQNQKTVALPWEAKDVDVKFAILTATRTAGSGDLKCVVVASTVEETEAGGRYATCTANASNY